MLDRDILLLQETFVSTEGVRERESTHNPRLRTQAVVVHEALAGRSRFMSSDTRGVAVEVGSGRRATVHISLQPQTFTALHGRCQVFSFSLSGEPSI